MIFQPPAAATETVLRLIEARAPLAMRGTPLQTELALGAGGLGLDSIAVVELLIECEAAVGIPFPPSLFDDGPLTIHRLVTHVRRQGS